MGLGQGARVGAHCLRRRLRWERHVGRTWELGGLKDWGHFCESATPSPVRQLLHTLLDHRNKLLILTKISSLGATCETIPCPPGEGVGGTSWPWPFLPEAEGSPIWGFLSAEARGGPHLLSLAGDPSDSLLHWKAHLRPESPAPRGHPVQGLPQYLLPFGHALSSHFLSAFGLF